MAIVLMLFPSAFPTFRQPCTDSMDGMPTATLRFGVVTLTVCALLTDCSNTTSSGSPGGVADSRISGDATVAASERDSPIGCARGSAVGQEKAELAAVPQPKADSYEVDPDLVLETVRAEHPGARK